MSFFNKKEEVLDIELTQFGKYMLSKGTLKPVYYTFSDDEILYSTEYADSTKEVKKETSERIQKETQRIKNLYTYEGVETRILKLNGHQVLDRGTGYKAGKTGKIEKVPMGELYGRDYQDDISMNSEEKNIVRNYLGHSNPGDRRVPTWEVESLLGGDIKSVNISSSTPNIGIKRPVINMEVDYEINAEIFPETDTDNTISVEQYRTQSGLEKQLFFVDNTTVTIKDDALILSVIEEGVEYEKENFEVEMFIEDVIYNGRIFSPGLNTFIPRFEIESRRLYFADNLEESQDQRYVDYYFDYLSDQDAADVYGIDIFGTQRDKLKELVKNTIAMMQGFDDESEEFVEQLDDILDPCDPDDDLDIGPEDYDYEDGGDD